MSHYKRKLKLKRLESRVSADICLPWIYMSAPYTEREKEKNRGDFIWREDVD